MGPFGSIAHRVRRMLRPGGSADEASAPLVAVAAPRAEAGECSSPAGKGPDGASKASAGATATPAVGREALALELRLSPEQLAAATRDALMNWGAHTGVWQEAGLPAPHLPRWLALDGSQALDSVSLERAAAGLAAHVARALPGFDAVVDPESGRMLGVGVTPVFEDLYGDVDALGVSVGDVFCLALREAGTTHLPADPLRMMGRGILTGESIQEEGTALRVRAKDPALSARALLAGEEEAGEMSYDLPLEGASDDAAPDAGERCALDSSQQQLASRVRALVLALADARAGGASKSDEGDQGTGAGAAAGEWDMHRPYASAAARLRSLHLVPRAQSPLVRHPRYEAAMPQQSVLALQTTAAAIGSALDLAEDAQRRIAAASETEEESARLLAASPLVGRVGPLTAPSADSEEQGRTVNLALEAAEMAALLAHAFAGGPGPRAPLSDRTVHALLRPLLDLASRPEAPPTRMPPTGGGGGGSGGSAPGDDGERAQSSLLADTLRAHGVTSLGFLPPNLLRPSPAQRRRRRRRPRHAAGVDSSPLAGAEGEREGSEEGDHAPSRRSALLAVAVLAADSGPAHLRRHLEDAGVDTESLQELDEEQLSSLVAGLPGGDRMLAVMQGEASTDDIPSAWIPESEEDVRSAVRSMSTEELALLLRHAAENEEGENAVCAGAPDSENWTYEYASTDDEDGSSDGAQAALEEGGDAGERTQEGLGAAELDRDGDSDGSDDGGGGGAAPAPGSGGAGNLPSADSAPSTTPLPPPSGGGATASHARWHAPRGKALEPTLPRGVDEAIGRAAYVVAAAVGGAARGGRSGLQSLQARIGGRSTRRDGTAALTPAPAVPLARARGAAAGQGRTAALAQTVAPGTEEEEEAQGGEPGFPPQALRWWGGDGRRGGGSGWLPGGSRWGTHGGSPGSGSGGTGGGDARVEEQEVDPALLDRGGDSTDDEGEEGPAKCAEPAAAEEEEEEVPLLEKSNILMLGPTGTGKTLIARRLSEVLDVPLVVADCTSLTQAGYVGQDVDDMLVRLYHAAGGDVARAQSGIIYLDELDKISASGQRNDIAGCVPLRCSSLSQPPLAHSSPYPLSVLCREGVQQSLLKMIEGTTMSCSVKVRGESKTVEIDTRNILFIGAGAFPGLERTIKARTAAGSIGFGAEVQRRESEGDDLQLLPHVRAPCWVGWVALESTDMLAFPWVITGHSGGLVQVRHAAGAGGPVPRAVRHQPADRRRPRLHHDRAQERAGEAVPTPDAPQRGACGAQSRARHRRCQ